ncbi:hypothetical protein EV424DRAFT_572838 [Suillus variegatus]|nr:hypothetical protein EV424DRAFT_572838 [Suillus variegatus]
MQLYRASLSIPAVYFKVMGHSCRRDETSPTTSNNCLCNGMMPSACYFVQTARVVYSGIELVSAIFALNVSFSAERDNHVYHTFRGWILKIIGDQCNGKDCKGTKARPLWREATALSIEDRLRHARTTDYEPGLLPPCQDICHSRPVLPERPAPPGKQIVRLKASFTQCL